jgi:hypothetical protein
MDTWTNNIIGPCMDMYARYARTPIRMEAHYTTQHDQPSHHHHTNDWHGHPCLHHHRPSCSVLHQQPSQQLIAIHTPYVDRQNSSRARKQLSRWPRPNMSLPPRPPTTPPQLPSLHGTTWTQRNFV